MAKELDTPSAASRDGEFSSSMSEMIGERTWTLTDTEKRIWVEEFNIGPRDLGLPEERVWSIGEPFLEEGARLVVPARAVAPRDRGAAEGIDGYDS